MSLGIGRAADAGNQIVLLAPSGPLPDLPASFQNIGVDVQRREALLADMQRLRGRVYLSDGAIDRLQLTSDGRYWLPVDERAWHLLSLDKKGCVTGCARYLSHPSSVRFDHLGVRRSALARMDHWGARLRAAVENELVQARRDELAYVEVGGWAITDERRNSLEGLRIALAAYALARILGGCLGITTATLRHGSSGILRRIGGNFLEAEGESLPTYYDPQYACDMEILRFDSRYPAPKYRSWVEELQSYLKAAPLITSRPVYSPVYSALGSQLHRLDLAVRSPEVPVWDVLPSHP